MKCSDPLVSMLKSYGYGLIALPKPDIAPLQILIRNGRALERGGLLNDLFRDAPNVALPQISSDLPLVKELAHQKTCGIQAKVALTLLERFLKSMSKGSSGLNGTTLEAAFQHAETIAFSFKDVLVNETNLLQLDSYIADARLNEHTASFRNLLDAGQVYIITATLKSNSFCTEITIKKGLSAGINIPDIKGVVGAGISMGFDNEDKNKLVYESEKPLVFAFKAVKIQRGTQGEYLLKSVNGLIMRGEEDFLAEELQSEEAFLDVL